MARYPRSAKINALLDAANVYAADLGAPALASTNRVVTDRAQANAAYTIANASPADGLARNVTVTGTQAGGSDDTAGTITVTGTNVDGRTITEDLVPVNGSTVAGNKAFKTVTSVVQAGWTAGGTADRIIVGFGNKIGMPSAILRGNGQLASANQWILTLLNRAVVVGTFAFDADEIEKNTVDASVGTYDGTKRLVALMMR